CHRHGTGRAYCRLFHRRRHVVHRQFTPLCVFLPTGPASYACAMAYLVQLVNDTSEVIDGADAYQQEGPLTTFFRTAPGRSVVDFWRTGLASFRTADIRVTRRLPAATAA